MNVVVVRVEVASGVSVLVGLTVLHVVVGVVDVGVAIKCVVLLCRRGSLIMWMLHHARGDYLRLSGVAVCGVCGPAKQQ